MNKLDVVEGVTKELLVDIYLDQRLKVSGWNLLHSPLQHFILISLNYNKENILYKYCNA